MDMCFSFAINNHPTRIVNKKVTTNTVDLTRHPGENRFVPCAPCNGLWRPSVTVCSQKKTGCANLLDEEILPTQGLKCLDILVENTWLGIFCCGEKRTFSFFSKDVECRMITMNYEWDQHSQTSMMVR